MALSRSTRVNILIGNGHFLSHFYVLCLPPMFLAWQTAFKEKPNLSLHIGDFSHPNPAGSYLNACVFYETLFGRSPEGLPRTIRSAAGKVLVDLSESDAKLLQHAAFETCSHGAPQAAH